VCFSSYIYLKMGWEYVLKKFNLKNFKIHLLKIYEVEGGIYGVEEKTKLLTTFTRNWELLNLMVIIFKFTIDIIYICLFLKIFIIEFTKSKTKALICVFSTFIAYKTKLLITFTSLFKIQSFKCFE